MNLKFKISNLKLKREGFTLIELMIYVAIFGGAAFLLTGTLTTVIRVQSREALSTDLSNQLTFVLDTTTRLVRESTEIQSVACTGNFCSVALTMPVSGENPSIITSDTNGIYLRQGENASDSCDVNEPVNEIECVLTNNKVEVVNFILSEVTVLGAGSILNIDIALKTKTANPQLQITRSLKSAIGER